MTQEQEYAAYERGRQTRQLANLLVKLHRLRQARKEVKLSPFQRMIQRLRRLPKAVGEK